MSLKSSVRHWLGIPVPNEDNDNRHSILNDVEITEYAESGMIQPFMYEQIKEMPTHAIVRGDNSYGKRVDSVKKVISYGLSSFGYDIRAGDKFRVFSPNPNKAGFIDPKNFDESLLIEVDGDCMIPPNSYALCFSVERFDIPDDIMVLVVGKSTYARCGIIIGVTPGEPGWEGHWTIEISNATPVPAKIYAGEGIAQCLFFRGPRPNSNYSDKDGKYQNQTAQVTLPRM